MESIQRYLVWRSLLIRFAFFNWWFARKKLLVYWYRIKDSMLIGVIFLWEILEMLFQGLEKNYWMV